MRTTIYPIAPTTLTVGAKAEKDKKTAQILRGTSFAATGTATTTSTTLSSIQDKAVDKAVMVDKDLQTYISTMSDEDLEKALQKFDLLDKEDTKQNVK